MKRFIAALLTAATLVAAVMCSPLTASADTNYYTLFDRIISGYLGYSSSNSVGTFEIAYWACLQYSDNDAKYVEYDQTTDVISEPDPDWGDYGHWRQFPADKFDKYVKKVAKFDGSFRDMVKKANDEFVVYRSSDNTYVIIYDFARSGATPMLRGYTKSDSKYTCYYSSSDCFETRAELESELKKEGLTFDSAQDRIYYDKESELYNFAYNSDYFKVDVSYDGKYIMLLDQGEVSSIPSADKLIRWDTVVSSGSTSSGAASGKADSSKASTASSKAGDSHSSDAGEQTSSAASREAMTSSEVGGVTYNTVVGVSIDGGKAFPAGAVVTAKHISDGEAFARAKKALGAADNQLKVFDISAKLDSAAVQPDGKVTVTFTLPSGFKADSTKLYYITADGKMEEIKLTADKGKKTVSAQLEHFSTYALCDMSVAASADGSAKSGSNTAVWVIAVVIAAAAAAAVAVVLIKKKKAA